MATIFQGEKKSIDGTDKISSGKWKRSKFDVTGELLDKLIGMQEKNGKMLMEVQMKRARLEEKQMEIDIQMRREKREFQLQMMSIVTHNTHGIYVITRCSIIYIPCILLVGMATM